jgi:hypothetical protein
MDPEFQEKVAECVRAIKAIWDPLRSEGFDATSKNVAHDRG